MQKFIIVFKKVWHSWEQTGGSMWQLEVQQLSFIYMEIYMQPRWHFKSVGIWRTGFIGFWDRCPDPSFNSKLFVYMQN